MKHQICSYLFIWNGRTNKSQSYYSKRDPLIITYLHRTVFEVLKRVVYFMDLWLGIPTTCVRYVVKI